MLEAPARLVDGHPRAFALAYGGALDSRCRWEAGYALVDPDGEPQEGELCAFGDIEDAAMLPWPGGDGGGGAFLGVVAGFLDVRPLEREARAGLLLGTASCPYRPSCEAVRAEQGFHARQASEWAEAAIVLAEALMDARGEKRTHERLNAILNGALRACRERGSEASRG